MAREALLKAHIGNGIDFRLGSRGAFRHSSWPASASPNTIHVFVSRALSCNLGAMRALTSGAGEARGGLISGFTG